RHVALKVLTDDAALTPTGVERFAREIRTAARLQHPHICTVLDSGETCGRVWYAMPFVDGESLRDRLRRTSPLDVATARRILLESAQALQVAHGDGIVHRDIKPENLLLTRDGATLVADFGIARGLQLADGLEGSEAVDSGGPHLLTATGMLIGTPAYMSPEQLDGVETITGASDQYALALVGYEMLAGRHPFANFDGTLPRRRARRDVLPGALHLARPDVPRALSEAIARAMCEEPRERFPSMADFARAIEEADTARPAPGAPLASPTLPRRSRLVVTAAAALVAVAAVAFVVFRGAGDTGGTGRAPAAVAQSSPAAIAPATGTDASEAGESPRLIVLPFDNVGEPGDAYFADGLSDAIRTTLGSGTGFEVVARATSMSLRAGGLGLEGAARELGARYLLTGTVRWARGEARVVIDPSLVEVVRGVAVTRWEESITTPLADVFDVQARIAARVAAATHVALGLPRSGGSVERPTRDLLAYDDYLAGEAASQGGTVIDAPSLQRAAAKYASAVARDSTFGAAWARLALVRGFLLSRVPMTPDVVAAARRALANARRLAPGDVSTPFAESLIARFVDGDHERALAAVRQGLRDHPTDALLLSQGAMLELVTGRPDSALMMLQLARRIDPRNPGVWWRLAHVHAWLRQWDETDLAAARGLALAPGNMQLLHWRIMAALGRGDLPRARAVVDSGLASPAMQPALLLPYIAETFELWWVLNDRQQDALLALGDSVFGSPASRYVVRAQLLAARGDSLAARREATRAIPLLEREVERSPEMRAQLAASLVLAGRAREGLRVAEQALQRIRGAGDRQFGPSQAFSAAIALAWGAADERAIDELVALLAQPVYVSRDWLRIDPRLASLRQLARFRTLVAPVAGAS
ncbi:MAG: protein kinase, partial [Gemmatimonadota bacterium]